MRVLVVGELNADLVLGRCQGWHAAGREVLAEDFALTLGSASALCATALARLGESVTFAGKVGADLLGAYCLSCLRQAGVDTSLIVEDPRAATGATVAIATADDRALLTFCGAGAVLTGADVESLRFDGVGHLHISSYFLQSGLRPFVPTLFARATRAGWTTSLDPGFDPAETWGADLIETLRHVDVFLPNAVELAAISGVADPAAAIASLRNGRTLIVVKLGAQGCLALDGDRRVTAAPPRVETVDTTGAGDCFNAGFLHAWFQRRDLSACLRAGAICGALSTRGLGGYAAQASPADLAELDACAPSSS